MKICFGPKRFTNKKKKKVACMFAVSFSRLSSWPPPGWPDLGPHLSNVEWGNCWAPCQGVFRLGLSIWSGHTLFFLFILSWPFFFKSDYLWFMSLSLPAVTYRKAQKFLITGLSLLSEDSLKSFTLTFIACYICFNRMKCDCVIKVF